MLNQIAMYVQNNLSAQVGVASIVIEMALRLVKSEKPLSIAYGIDAALKQIGSICSGIGAFLDKVLPQNLK